MIHRSPTNEGHLMCDLCATQWCSHIEKFIRKMEDAELVWEKYPDDIEVQVPIVPTANLWANAVLISRADSITSYGLSLGHPDSSGVDPWGIKSAFIGFVNPGEGRIIFREMILDWFSANHADDEECKAPGHGYHENIRWQKDMRDPQLRLRQQWAVYMTGKCLGCTYDASRNSQFVPNVAVNSPWGVD